jgi:hypothetical protein
MTHLIQFLDLSDLMAELPAGHVVRVNTLDITEATYDMGELRVAGIGVHVRTINSDNHLLSCYLPVAVMQLFGRRPQPGDQDESKYNQAWEKAEALQRQVTEYLAGKGLHVRHGVIYLNGVIPMHGHWANSSNESASA